MPEIVADYYKIHGRIIKFAKIGGFIFELEIFKKLNVRSKRQRMSFSIN